MARHVHGQRLSRQLIHTGRLFELNDKPRRRWTPATGAGKSCRSGRGLASAALRVAAMSSTAWCALRRANLDVPGWLAASREEVTGVEIAKPTAEELVTLLKLEKLP